MLNNLYIENLAVIEKLSINFDKGLSVFTGETGAGKSIVIDAINAILGQRITKDIVRSGSTKAVIIASFTNLSKETIDKLIEFGFEYEDELIIQREISADGKTTARISSRPVAISVLKEIGTSLINIHGQHDNQIIMSADNHIDIIDLYAELENMRSEFSENYSELKSLQKKLNSFYEDESLKAQKIDLLTYQINEIDSTKLTENEDEELNLKHMAIRNSSKIVDSLGSACDNLFGLGENKGAVDLLSNASYQISLASGFYEVLSEISERIETLSIEVSEIASEINDYLDEFDFDQGEINAVEARLDEIYKLKRKYGQSVSEILDFSENAKKQLDEIEMSDENKAVLNQKIEELSDKLNKFAEILHSKREAAAKKFVKLVSEELKFLDMPNVTLKVDFEDSPLYNKGKDKIELLISTNPGEPPKSVSKIASGGELSRIMLAIKNTLADKDNIETLIFDEVDTGVSGSGSQKIGLKLKQVSENRQVICVTHSAQIAALADNHLYISKLIKENRTFTTVTELDFDGRKKELARIIGTDKITELTLKNAEEMLNMAHN